MTIHAYTEPGIDAPAYINISERVSCPGDVVITVRSAGENSASSIILNREQLRGLANDAAKHLDGDGLQAEKNKAIAASRNYEDESRRVQALDMALRTPGMGGHRDVLEAAAAYQAHISSQPVAQACTPSAGPDVKQMVDRFLGWRLPGTFHPDAGISFKPSQPPFGWPTGTNLFNAEEARAMFEYVLRTRPDQRHARSA